MVRIIDHNKDKSNYLLEVSKEEVKILHMILGRYNQLVQGQDMSHGEYEKKLIDMTSAFFFMLYPTKEDWDREHDDTYRRKQALENERKRNMDWETGENEVV